MLHLTGLDDPGETAVAAIDDRLALLMSGYTANSPHST